MPPSDDEADDLHRSPEMQFSYDVRETSRVLLETLKERIEPLGLTLTQFFLLRHLWDGEGVSQTELSERLATTQPATVATLDGLEARGLVKRVRTAEDRRVARIYLTAKGRTLRSKLLAIAHASSSDALDGFSAAEIAQFRTMMERVRVNLNEHRRKARGA
jgi:DNA-binding MarR family transcriptional regulator